jgi:DNA-binding NtrC family response regulator
MDDLETAVPVNAAFEAAGFETVLVSIQDDVRDLFRSSNPDIVVLTGALQEQRSAVLLALARDRPASTLGLIEGTTPDPTQLARQLSLTAWMVKPVDPGDAAAAARRLVGRRRLQEHTGILGESPAIQEVLVKIEQMAPVSSTVLIEGESGTGKELVAQGMHHLSPRREGPFIAVNCAALPETLLESELFGHEKGAFTGAAERRLGRFELADRGSIFLDEIGEMPLSLQVKLLRVLETRSFFRVGGTQAIHIDARVIAATNQSLKELTALGAFREDLYFRLNVLNIYLPPLRERKSDIPILVRQFVTELSETHGRSFRGITPEAVQILVDADLVESMVVLAPGREIHASDIPADVREGGTRLLPVRIPGNQREVAGQELEFILRSLVELKLQMEELRRRMDDGPQRVEVIDAARLVRESVPFREVVELGGTLDNIEVQEVSPRVLYQSGMTMSQVEQAAIEAALEETTARSRNSVLGEGC